MEKSFFLKCGKTKENREFIGCWAQALKKEKERKVKGSVEKLLKPI